MTAPADPSPPVVEALLRQVLDLRAAGAPPPWPAPAPDAAAAASYFLLDVDEDGGVEWFVVHTLPLLLTQLLHTSERTTGTYRDELPGRVIWPATYKARHSGGFDPNVFVCQELYSRFDTPENQLLKYLIGAIGRCLPRVPEVLRSGVCYVGAGERRVGVDTLQRLRRMEASLHQMLRNIRLRSISTPDSIGGEHLTRAANARLEEYAVAARIYRRYQATVLRPAWGSLAEAGRRALLLPARPGPDAAPWIDLAARLLCA